MVLVFGLGLQSEEVIVRSFWKKEIPPGLMLPILIGYFVLMAWFHLFPLASHPDLRFQIVGELVADAAMIGMFAFLFLRFKDFRRRAAARELTHGEQLISAIVYAVVMLTVNWRDFFPGDRFQFSAGVGTLVGVAFATAVFMAISFSTPQGKPAKEDEKSVV